MITKAEHPVPMRQWVHSPINRARKVWEYQQDRLVRRAIACPTCNAEAGHCCRWTISREFEGRDIAPGGAMAPGHPARYREATWRGLWIPPRCLCGCGTITYGG